MTRLTTADIQHIVTQLADYDRELTAKTGCSLRGIACHAAGIEEERFAVCMKSVIVGVIPVTSGEGAIAGFCSAVGGIVNHLGCKSFITKTTDVAGLAEAFEKEADVVMLSDDDRFVAINLRHRRVTDNTAATACGFVAGLSLMAGGLRQKKTLVIGCGPLGCSASERLTKMGARLTLYDIDLSRCRRLAKTLTERSANRIRIENDLDRALCDHQYIIDATPAANIIRLQHIRSNTCIAAPGVPCGLDAEAKSKAFDRLLHDPLQIGVATMTVCALKSEINR